MISRRRHLMLAQPFQVCAESRVRIRIVPLRGSMHLWPHFLLLGKDSSSEGAAIRYSVSCWAFYLEAAQNLGVTNIGWNVIPFLLFFLSQPLGPPPSVYCLREMRPLTLSQFAVYTAEMTLKRFVCMFSILICPVDKIRPICRNASSSFELTQKFLSS